MNTKNFRFHMPVAVHYGVGIAHNMTGRIRGERVMIVCDPFLYQSGVAEKLGGVTCMIVACGLTFRLSIRANRNRR